MLVCMWCGGKEPEGAARCSRCGRRLFAAYPARLRWIECGMWACAAACLGMVLGPLLASYYGAIAPIPQAWAVLGREGMYRRGLILQGCAFGGSLSMLGGALMAPFALYLHPRLHRAAAVLLGAALAALTAAAMDYPMAPTSVAGAIVGYATAVIMQSHRMRDWITRQAARPRR